MISTTDRMHWIPDCINQCKPESAHVVNTNQVQHIVFILHSDGLQLDATDATNPILMVLQLDLQYYQWL